jgi:gamma-polyglutamate synthase
MTVFLSLIIITVFLTLLGLQEYRKHLNQLSKIPIRIHVNGTRGKSSVTRLIAAGLRAGGIKAFAKTTGTTPKVISDSGDEFSVYRPSGANIIEQLRVVDFAAKNGAQALVIECMALQPMYQSLCELKLIRSTLGVITNARADHLDVMGPEEIDVAKALLGTTPVNGKFFTAERDYISLFREASKDRGSEINIIDEDDIGNIPDKYMDGFSYIEHAENVALSLKVCEALGVDRETAIKGMHKVQPDVGAMSENTIEWFGRSICFVNGFAANDAESTETIWNMSLERNNNCDKIIMIINCRDDRPDRSYQLGSILKNWKVADHYFVIGTGAYSFIRTAVKHGLPAKKIIDLENEGVSEIFEKIVEYSDSKTMVFGAGNIKGIGLELVKYFANRVTHIKG